VTIFLWIDCIFEEIHEGFWIAEVNIWDLLASGILGTAFLSVSGFEQ